METAPASHGQVPDILIPPRGPRNGRWVRPSAPGMIVAASLLIAPAGQVFAADSQFGVRILAQINANEPGGASVPRPGPAIPVPGRPSQTALLTLDDMFAAVAARVPQFGGMYLAPDRTLQVALTDVSPAVVETARQAVTEIFGPERIRSGGFHPVISKYGFAQLHGMRIRARDILAMPGVVSLDTNERQNRVKVGLARMDVQADVESRLTALSIPLDAVVFERQLPARPYAPDPQALTRPTVGGLQVGINGGGGFCSIGFLVRRSGVNGFVTASHCTSSTGVMDGIVSGTFFDQPKAAGAGMPSNRVGTEIVDPPLFTGGTCPSGRRCRLSDSIFASIPAGVTGQVGQIIHPGDPNFPGNFSILGDSVPLSGENVGKVGRTTGVTGGEVSDTGVDINQAFPNGGDSGITLLSQTRVKAFSAPGDSGSPVFTFTPDPYNVFLAGILWGGPSDNSYFDYSPFQLVQAELALGFEFVDSDQPPTVTITNPPNNASVPYGALTSVTFDASAFDFEQGATCCTFTWESDKDGPMGTGASRPYFFFTPGNRTVTVTATDGSGNQAKDFIHLHTGNSPPLIWIVKPTNGTTIVAGSSSLFEGNSFDPEPFAPLPCGMLTWSSSNSTDTSFPQTGCSPQVSFATPGQRTIVLTGVDPEGGTGVATPVKVNVVAFSAGSPPVVSILSPTTSQVVGPAGPISLKGIAAAVDGKPVSYRWMLQGNPPLAIGQGSAPNNQPFTTTWNPTPQQLPFACGGYTFTIRLEATDSGNAVGSDTVPAYVPYPVC